MKSFFINIFRFSLPFIIYILMVLYIDPYNLIQIEKNIKLSEIKSKTSLPLNYRLYKLSNFLNNPTDVIMLGDSRVDAIDTNYFNNLNGKKSTNLAYGGGSLSEIIESFWFVSNAHNLKEVYIGINFNLWNKHNNLNLVNESLDLIQSPMNYIFSKDCLKSTFLILKILLFKQEKINIENPKSSKEDFWKYQIESSANNFYRIWDYPTQYMYQLSQIAEYCKLNNIKLVFFTPPTHIDLQSKVTQFKLVHEELKFKNDLSKLGLYYDFDYPNEITKNKKLFKDPFHSNDSVTKIVVNEILTRKIKYAKIANP